MHGGDRSSTLRCSILEVAEAQIVERLVVTQEVAGASPASHLSKLKMNKKQIQSFEKYNHPPPDGQLCERCKERNCDYNEFGKKMWICNECATLKTPILVNKARGTSSKGRFRRS